MTRVLIICYYWPPAGGPGVQRWLKFVKYLPQFGIEPVVYIPENPSYPLQDNSLLEEVPGAVKILKYPIKEPYALASLFSKKQTNNLSAGIIQEHKKQSLMQRMMLYIRGNFFIPDARRLWVGPSVGFLGGYLDENPVDAIITTGPPHSLHLIGLSLKRKKNLPWLVDFRDPWTTIGYHEQLKLTKKSRKKHEALEHEVLNAADAVIVTSPSTKRDLEKKTQSPVTCITNGFDEEEVPQGKPGVYFTLAHIGSLLSKRNPEILWKILAQIKQERFDFAERLKIKLAGKVSETVLQSLDSHGLKENVELTGYLTHPEALRAQHEAFALLLIEIDTPETQVIIPGKVFEYLAARRPILAVGPSGADFFELVEQCDSGRCFTYQDEEAIKAFVIELFEAYRAGKELRCTGDIDRFYRKNLTGQLAKVIKKTITSI
ncbi:MAG: glycosyl transferase family 1 [Cytophagaceae bacterium]|nr:glycosyl transferase family 1 [Cytophagaceae bacterium]